MFRISVFAMLLLLGGCDDILFPKCNIANEWLDKKVRTKDELRQEINAIFVDNNCGSITPEKVRKVLFDMMDAK